MTRFQLVSHYQDNCYLYLTVISYDSSILECIVISQSIIRNVEPNIQIDRFEFPQLISTKRWNYQSKRLLWLRLLKPRDGCCPLTHEWELDWNFMRNIIYEMIILSSSQVNIKYDRLITTGFLADRAFLGWHNNHKINTLYLPLNNRIKMCRNITVIRAGLNIQNKD